MNFFEAQDKARRQTGWLVVLFLLAVAGLIIITNLLVLGVLAYNQTGQFVFSPSLLQQQFAWDIFVGVAIVVISLVFLGSLYKTMALSGGGRSVAEMLDGRLIDRGSHDPDEQRVLNVVEEMAIASGMPVPPVYLLDEDGINAFAAGLSPNNAVIGITRGAIARLNRDELQGVIAHEFSHIFNGDMRMNIRLIGVLHGILLLGLIGYYILRGMRFMRSSRNQKGASAAMAIFVLGLGLVVIGYIGFFFGQWIKAMVSRQREFLADASAVQFTRNKDGIAGALKKIGGLSAGSLLQNPAAPQYSHAYFSRGVGGLLQFVFATHPPLDTRIKRIEPGWNGKYILPKPAEPVAEEETGKETLSARQQAMLGAAVAAGVLNASDVIDRVGTVGQQDMDTARQILVNIPPALKQAAAEPFGARAVIYGMLLDHRQDIRQQQDTILAQQADPAVAEHTRQLKPELEQMPELTRLPLIELALPTLQTLSADQYQQFRQVVQELIAADKTVDLKEWIIQQLVIQQLDQSFGLREPPRAKHAYLGAVKTDAEALLSLVAQIEHPNASRAEHAFEAGKAAIGAGALQFMARQDLSLELLNNAMHNLAQLKPLLKPRILKACAACIMYDGTITVRGYELLRILAICLESPMPPLSGSLQT